MPLSADFRARSATLLDTAPDDATIVVASTGPDGHLLMQTSTPTPHGLIAVARALLQQAHDDLDRDDATDREADLAEMLAYALAELPAEPEAA